MAVILRCRPETYCCHVNSCAELVLKGLLAEIVELYEDSRRMSM